MEVLEKYEVAGLAVEIRADEDPQSPREWNNIGKMVCFHPRYELGDPLKTHGFDSPDLFREWREENPDALVLPLILLDHSGLSMSTSREWPYNCPWDAGQVGWIYASRERVVREYGDFSEQSQKKALEALRGEVSTYDEYLRGMVYGYTVKDGGEVVDSRWGFYGYEYCKKEASAAAEAEAVRIGKERGTWVNPDQLALPFENG